MLLAGALTFLVFCHIILLPPWVHHARAAIVTLLTCGCFRRRRPRRAKSD
jgi:hypothetical protein